MPGIKELKTRIKSIGSTRKITRAMQMVSAAKMRKAQQAALNSRTYSELAWELIRNLTGVSGGVIPTDPSAADLFGNAQGRPELNRMGDGSGGIPYTSDNQKLRDSSARMHSLGMTQENPLLKTYPQAQKTGIIVISTNKGLVGGFNANLIAKYNSVVSPFMGSSDGNKTADKSANYITELLVMGRKAKDFAVRFNKPMMADFPKSDSWVSIESIYPLAKMVSDIYATGQYKQIVIIYNQFVSTLVQKATIKQLLPFTPTTPSRSASHPSLAGGETAAPRSSPPFQGGVPPLGGEVVGATEYLFEPTPELVLNNLLPRIIESQIYQAVLESDASEHSARMVMMKNATEAAGDLIADYTLTYNQLRQNKITTELSEITAGRIALE